MVKLYVRQILDWKMTIEDVPLRWRSEVSQELKTKTT